MCNAWVPFRIQLSKQLDVEAASVAKKQQNGGGQHDSGQQDSAVVVALNDRVAELEKEVERVKSSTLTRNTVSMPFMCT